MSKDQRGNALFAREHAEPNERNNPVPWLLGLVAASLCVWGVSYFLLDPDLAPATASPSQSSSAAPKAEVAPPESKARSRSRARHTTA
jgi:hypothetical protein